jgi:hypothetical protein
MRSRNATVFGSVAAAVTVAAGLACRQAARTPARPPDAGAMVTVYVAPGIADRVMGRLQLVAARHQWALSVRTDSAAVGEADLRIVDSAGRSVGRIRPGSPVAVQAQQMADAVRH